MNSRNRETPSLTHCRIKETFCFGDFSSVFEELCCFLSYPGGFWEFSYLHGSVLYTTNQFLDSLTTHSFFKPNMIYALHIGLKMLPSSYIPNLCDFLESTGSRSVLHS